MRIFIHEYSYMNILSCDSYRPWMFSFPDRSVVSSLFRLFPPPLSFPILATAIDVLVRTRKRETRLPNVACSRDNSRTSRSRVPQWIPTICAFARIPYVHRCNRALPKWSWWTDRVATPTCGPIDARECNGERQHRERLRDAPATMLQLTSRARDCRLSRGTRRETGIDIAVFNSASKFEHHGHASRGQMKKSRYTLFISCICPIDRRFCFPPVTGDAVSLVIGSHYVNWNEWTKPRRRPAQGPFSRRRDRGRFTKCYVFIVREKKSCQMFLFGIYERNYVLE